MRLQRSLRSEASNLWPLEILIALVKLMEANQGAPSFEVFSRQEFEPAA